MTCGVAAAQQEEWAGTYHCGATKSDPAGRPGYSSPVRMTVKDGTANLLRDSGRIRESMSGKVAADGRMVLEGTGQFKDSGTSWRFRFEGRFEGAGFEAKGSMYPARGGAALRDCTMTLSRISAPAAREAKATRPEKKEAAPGPSPPEVVAKAEPPAPPPKIEPPPPPPKGDPPKADPPPAVRAALESAGTEFQPEPKPSFFGYSRTDLALIAVFIICAIAGVGLLVYDWRRNHNR